MRSRLLSASACTTSIAGGAFGQDARSRTASAASSVNPPSKIEHCAKAACSHGVSRSHDQSIAALSVSWRAAAPRAPARRLKRSRIRSTICAGESTRTRAAASSMASGRPSSSRTTSATAARLDSLRTKSGFCARARVAKSSIASTSSGSGSMGKISSPGKWRRSRLVTTKAASGARSSQRPSVPCACCTTCSKLSSITRLRPRPAMAWPSCTAGSSLPRGTPSEDATAKKMPSSERASERSQK